MSGKNGSHKNGSGGRQPFRYLLIRWEQAVVTTMERLRDVRWLISAWRRGMLSDVELYNRIINLLASVDLENWRFRIGLQIGSLEVHLLGRSYQHEERMIQISTLLQWIYHLSASDENADKREKVRRALEEVYRLL